MYLDEHLLKDMCLTFISAVSERPGAADGPRSVLQGGCAASQWVTLSVQVKGVLSGNAVGAAHAAAWWQVILTDIGWTHCAEKDTLNVYIFATTSLDTKYILI